MKFNIGCGNRDFGKDWVHIDGENYNHVESDDISLTSYENDCADLIYSSHFLEYFDNDELKTMLFSWKRVLKKNGILRVAVPDFEVCARLYSDGIYPLENFLGPLYGKMKMKKSFIYHKTTFDFIKLKKILKDLGMKEIKKYNWRKTEHSMFDDHSQAYLPHMDKENGILISLNVECVK